MTLGTLAQPREPSLLAFLRSLVPDRALEFPEALRLAEVQASHLRERLAATADALPEAAIADLPHVQVVRRRIPASGMTYWDGHAWIIALNCDEPEARQRFSLCHEYKHVIDHRHAGLLYRGDATHTAADQAEQAADYFAGCALMPKALLKRAWGDGTQTPAQLSSRFGVSRRAAEVRLAQIGLTEWRPARYGQRRDRHDRGGSRRAGAA